MITRIEKLIAFFLREPNSASPTIEVSASKMILDWLAIQQYYNDDAISVAR